MPKINCRQTQSFRSSNFSYTFSAKPLTNLYDLDRIWAMLIYFGWTEPVVSLKFCRGGVLLGTCHNLITWPNLFFRRRINAKRYRMFVFVQTIQSVRRGETPLRLIYGTAFCKLKIARARLCYRFFPSPLTLRISASVNKLILFVNYE